VIDEQLRAAVEELCQRARALVGLEAVLLLDRNPRQLAALAGELPVETVELLLALAQRVARRTGRNDAAWSCPQPQWSTASPRKAPGEVPVSRRHSRLRCGWSA
jgi:hypothetical protein